VYFFVSEFVTAIRRTPEELEEMKLILHQLEKEPVEGGERNKSDCHDYN